MAVRLAASCDVADVRAEVSELSRAEERDEEAGRLDDDNDERNEDEAEEAADDEDADEEEEGMDELDEGMGEEEEDGEDVPPVAPLMTSDALVGQSSQELSHATTRLEVSTIRLADMHCSVELLR